MPETKDPRKSPALRPQFSATLNQRTLALLRTWAKEDAKHVSHMIDDVVTFAAKNGFRDEA